MHDCPAVQRALGDISRSTVRRLWRSGQLKSVQIGSRRFSTSGQIAEYIARLESVAV
nr:helix-turn-helix domain-containing protein [Mycobacteroides abscessus]